VSIKGKKVYVITGPNKGAYGVVTHADHDSLRIAINPGDITELGVYDRIDNVVKAKEQT